MRAPSVTSSVHTKDTPYQNAIQSFVHSAELRASLFIVAHFILGAILISVPILSTLHAYATVALGVFWALTKPPGYAACAAGYVVGAEVLWRMTDASFFWEGGKYAVILILGLSLLQSKTKRIPVAPLCYFLLFLPSILLTLDAVGLTRTRDYVSFNLSGPLALFISAWFFSSLKLSSRQLQAVLFAIIAPIISISIFALLRTFSASAIVWNNTSMFASSGGFGPNQVSTVMGLGVVVVLLMLLTGKYSRISRVLLALIAVVFFIQGLLTFSRGGMVGALITSAFVALHAVRDHQQRVRLIVALLIFVPVMVFVVIPALNNMTQGVLETRFSDTNLTNRDVIIRQELQLFLDNPIAGAGPGVGTYLRGVAAHTEFTRMLGEHGLLGVASLCLLIYMAAHQYLRSKDIAIRGLRGSLILWSLLVMTNAAMRTASVSFMFGIPFAQINLDDDT